MQRHASPIISPVHSSSLLHNPEAFSALPALDDLEVIRVLDPSLHENECPYKTSLCSRYRVLSVIMAVYLATQIIALVIIMICWNRGIYTLFDGSLHDVISKIISHMVTCMLQILVRIYAPHALLL